MAFDPEELTGQLLPALRVGDSQRLDAATYGDDLVRECRLALSQLLPLNDTERAFLDLLLDKGKIDATLLTTDTALQERIQAQPLLAWKAQNVRSYKGLS